MNDDPRPSPSGNLDRDDAARRDYVPGAVDEDSYPGGSEEAAKILVESFEPVEPDPQVWDRIAADINRSNGVPADTVPADGVPADTTTAETTSEVVDLDSRRRMLPALFSIAAVFLAVLGTTLIVNAASDDGATVASVVYELVDPESGDVTMTLTASNDGIATATAIELEQLADDQTYQLWSVVGDEIVSVGLLGSAPDSVPLRIEGEPSVLALTVEASGGVAVSQATPVAVWQASS